MNNLPKITLISLLSTAVLYILLYIYVDIPVAQWASTLSNTPIFHINEIISFTADMRLWGPLLVISLVTVFFVEYKYGKKVWTRSILYIIFSILLASLLGDTLKFLLGRYRPVLLTEEAKYGFQFFGDSWKTHSTPSGHTFRIFSLMTALGFIFKPYRWLFIIFASIVGVSRIILHDHYPSDVLFGAYLGIMSAVWMYWYMYCRKEPLSS